ncbi:lysophospholipid acyltransferase family protein [Sulfuricaulis sp.]|jgi:KDO2-lipid IV(A) lauroyltransferase|uniref:lysophospholipid acyltransferase family protein n=1 Tax=Sulfuricaulis sp. TaxID=2003553 RepID=UPI00355A9B4C
MRAFFLKLVFHLFAALPLPVAHALGAVLGWLFLVIPNKRRRTAEINIELCFPEMSRGARQRLLRRNMIELGKSVTEIGVLWTRNEKKIRRLVRRVSGKDKLEKALHRGQGLLLAVPHLGAWEMIGLWGSLHHPMTSLFRAPPISQMGKLMRATRERFSARLVSADNTGIRALYKAIERGEMVAILPDQVPSTRSGSVFAPFFGIPASTMVLLSRLAIKTGAPVMFAYAERLPHGRGYHLHFLPASPDINHGGIESSAATVNAMVEKCVRAAPEQYQWVYKRFRVRPAGEKAFY